jgi:hypothetical protein
MERPKYQPEQGKTKPNDPKKGLAGSLGKPPPGPEQTQQREINRQLARARRLDYRKNFQTRLPERMRPVEDTLLQEVELTIVAKQYREMREQQLAHLTPEERERQNVIEEMDYLKESRTMTMKVNYAQHLKSELLDKMQRFDPEFMNPIIEVLTKRPARQAKVERAIQRRGINPGVDDYKPLWER